MRRASKRQLMQDDGIARPVKSFLCPPNSLQISSGMAAGDSKLKQPALLLSHRPIVSTYKIKLHLVNEELGKSSA